MNMSTLYELKEEHEALMNMLYDEEVDEQTVFDTLEGIEGEIEEKADNYAKIMKLLSADTEALKNEEDRLKRRRETLENNIDRMKRRLYETMKETGKAKFKTQLFSFSIVKNGGKQPLKLDVVDVSEIPSEYLIPQPPKPDNDAIRKALEEQELTWAHLEPRGEHLTIR
ncbi:siphovirus Gp157 family protein [Diplocloster agilis]|uniref:siphovirus Gp157 family protein n=1 Tax=Diplocloster agilis TaxID=2850323 RepID=UPI001EE9764E|nr:siphovirus Gp157 family protein [Diplocloster agilis]